jgi:hypothetical protein
MSTRLPLAPGAHYALLGAPDSCDRAQEMNAIRAHTSRALSPLIPSTEAFCERSSIPASITNYGTAIQTLVPGYLRKAMLTTSLCLGFLSLAEESLVSHIEARILPGRRIPRKSHRMDLRPTFARNLRRLRLQRGLSQFDVAFRANMDPSYIGRIERMTTGVGIDIIGRLVDVLEIEPAELFCLTRDQAARLARRRKG